VESSAERTVLVRAPRLDHLAAELIRAGAQVQHGTDDSLEVSGLDSAAIGELAFAKGLVLHELATQNASLETAFMEMTHDSVEYRGSEVPG
jgi:ABC-2 type transport system ATP-binding protein